MFLFNTFCNPCILVGCSIHYRTAVGAYRGISWETELQTRKSCRIYETETLYVEVHDSLQKKKAMDVLRVWSKQNGGGRKEISPGEDPTRKSINGLNTPAGHVPRTYVNLNAIINWFLLSNNGVKLFHSVKPQREQQPVWWWQRPSYKHTTQWLPTKREEWVLHSVGGRCLTP